MPNGSVRRFQIAQAQAHAGFAEAMSELRASQKRSHWIWYVFPQLVGLGSSAPAVEYGIRGAEEAAEYLRDPVLSTRLLEATREVANQLETGVTLRALMGSEIDALKLVSSLTLFESVAEQLSADDASADLRTLAELASVVLSAADVQGYSRCRFTREHLAALNPRPPT